MKDKFTAVLSAIREIVRHRTESEVTMTLRDLYCYTPNTQKFILFSETDKNDDLWERVPIFKGYLENCNVELMDEIVDHFLVGANRTIIVVLCI